MKRIVFVFLLLVTALGAQAQIVRGETAPMVLKNGTLILDGNRLRTGESIVAAIGQDAYRQTWKPAASMRKAGISLISVGSLLTAWGLSGYITGLCVQWPDREQDPEGWDKLNKTYNATKFIIGGGLVCLGAGIPLFCVGTGRLKRVRDGYNEGLAVSMAPGGLGVTYRF